GWNIAPGHGPVVVLHGKEKLDNGRVTVAAPEWMICTSAVGNRSSGRADRNRQGALERCGRPAITLADHPREYRTMQGSSISAVRIERTAHPVAPGHVSADQRGCVVRDRIELSTFRFSAGLSFSGPTGPATTEQPASPAKTPGRAGMPWCR